MLSLRKMFGHLKELRHYLAFSAVIMAAGMFIGGTNPALDIFIQGQISSLRQVANSIESSDHSTLLFIVFIFFNNAIKSVLVMYLGALFGIVPIVFLAVNGMMIGYLVSKAADQGGDVLFTLIVKGLLPHGVLEIPAILIACAYGLRFGTMMLQGVGVLFNRRQGWGRALELFVIRTIPAIVLITVVLLIAAVIESTVTAWLLGK